MSFLSLRHYALGMAVLACTAAPLRAQSPANDSLFRRAKRLVADGNGVAGRALVDSLLRGAPEGTPDFGDALYWRGALAETAADAERDYRRVIVEYPLSAYADNALLAMADLESARGERASALQHLQRFVKEHPVSSPARGTAALSAARLAFEQRDTRAACAMISAARVSTPAASVEARNQIDYLATRCAGMEVTSAPPPAPVSNPAVSTTAAKDTTTRNAPRPIAVIPKPPAPKPPVTVAKTDSTKAADVRPMQPTVQPTPEPTAPPRVTTSAPVPAPVPTNPVPAPVRAQKGTYTIQLAAYNTRVDAERLVAKLTSKGVEARVSGVEKPFRVRLKFYPTRQAAQDEVASLKARGIIGFVTTEAPPQSATP